MAALTRILYVASGYRCLQRVADVLNKVALPDPNRVLFDVTDSNIKAIERLSRVAYHAVLLDDGNKDAGGGLDGNAAARLIRTMLQNRVSDLVIVQLTDKRAMAASAGDELTDDGKRRKSLAGAVDWSAINMVLLTPWSEKTLLRLLGSIKADSRRRLQRTYGEALSITKLSAGPGKGGAPPVREPFGEDQQEQRQLPPRNEMEQQRRHPMGTALRSLSPPRVPPLQVLRPPLAVPPPTPPVPPPPPQPLSLALQPVLDQYRVGTPLQQEGVSPLLPSPSWQARMAQPSPQLPEHEASQRHVASGPWSAAAATSPPSPSPEALVASYTARRLEPPSPQRPRHAEVGGCGSSNGGSGGNDSGGGGSGGGGGGGGGGEGSGGGGGDSGGSGGDGGGGKRQRTATHELRVETSNLSYDQHDLHGVDIRLRLPGERMMATSRPACDREDRDALLEAPATTPYTRWARSGFGDGDGGVGGGGSGCGSGSGAGGEEDGDGEGLRIGIFPAAGLESSLPTPLRWGFDGEGSKLQYPVGQSMSPLSGAYGDSAIGGRGEDLAELAAP